MEKKGHVALYLGNYKGQESIAEARTFAQTSKVASTMRQRLLEFLEKNPKYIAEHPQSVLW